MKKVRIRIGGGTLRVRPVSKKRRQAIARVQALLRTVRPREESPG